MLNIASEFGCEWGNNAYSSTQEGVNQRYLPDGAKVCTHPGVITA